MIQAEAGRPSGRAGPRPHSGLGRAGLAAMAGRLALAGLVLVLLLLGAAGARAAARGAGVTVDDVHAGSLLLRTDEPGRYLEALRTATDVAITVSGPTLRARVTQVFRNPGRDWVEGVYVYPLSEGAAVDAMKMVVGGRVVVADIREKQQARAIYERAKAGGRRAALVEQQRPNLFMNAIANIGPGDTVVIQIDYQEPVRQADDTFSLRVPLVVAPRFSPGLGEARTVAFEGGRGWGRVDQPAPAAPVLDPARNPPVNPVSIHVDLAAGFPIGEVTSAFHRIDVAIEGPDRRRISLADGAVPADRDFELRWKAVPSRTPAVGLFRERVGNDDYLLAFVTPPAAERGEAERRPREITFVIDNSGSMGGTSIEQAKASLAYALGRLTPADRFNVIRFDDTMTSLFGGTLPADADNLRRAQAFVAALQANGGTVMVPPMLAALNEGSSASPGFLRQVVFLTDGEIDNEQELFDAIAAHRGRSRVFMVGIGSAPNSYLMTRAAELGGGTFTAIGAVDQVQERMKQLVDRLENPAMTDVGIAFSAASADVTPRILPDLYRGDTLVVAAKVGSLAGTAEIGGMIDGRPWSVTLPLAEAAPGEGLSKLWARRKIDDAEVAQTLHRITSEEADRRILDLALAHHLVTRLTSLVAVDRTPVRPRGVRLTRSDVPLNLPAGWDFDKVFGTSGDPATQQRQALLDADGGPIRMIRPSADPAQAVTLPQTATDAELRLLAGLGLLAAGLGFGLATRRRRAVA
ncbi:marine proteobacterial sortase target protein [Labrys monachus]